MFKTFAITLALSLLCAQATAETPSFGTPIQYAESPAWRVVQSVTPMPDDAVLVTGAVLDAPPADPNSTGLTGFRAFALCLKADGSVAFLRTFTHPTENARIFRTMPQPDGSFVLHCIGDNNADGIILSTLIHMDAQGDVLSETETDLQYFSPCHGAGTLGLGSVPIAWDDPYITYIPGVTQYDPDGEVVWTQTYPSLVDHFFSFALLADDGYLLIGSSDRRPVVFKIDLAGNAVWHTYLDAVASISGAAPTGDGGLIAIGLAYEDESYAEKLDATWRLDADGGILWSKTAPASSYYNRILAPYGDAYLIARVVGEIGEDGGALDIMDVDGKIGRTLRYPTRSTHFPDGFQVVSSPYGTYLYFYQLGQPDTDGFATEITIVPIPSPPPAPR